MSPTKFCHVTHVNNIVDVVMWPKFGDSSISIREVIISIL